MKNTTRARLSVLISMVIFGTVGVVRMKIDLGSAAVSMARGIIGTLFLAAVYLFGRKKLDLAGIRKNAGRLLISGALLGINWLLLFESYRYVSVAVGTLCYYMAPIFIVLVSPLLFHQKYTLKTVLCAAVSLGGMVLVSGVLNGENQTALRGVAFGLAAAVAYAAVVLLNKGIRDLGGLDRTVTQLVISAVVLCPYVFLVERPAFAELTVNSWIALAVAGILHTGVAYALYFGSIEDLPAQTVALFSYVDPVVAVIASVSILCQPITAWEIVGILLILGATAVCEWPKKS